MKKDSSRLLVDLISEKIPVSSLSYNDWCDVIALSRQLGFLPFLYEKARNEDALDLLPESVFSQLKSASLEVVRQRESINWHLQQLCANNPQPIKSVLLKGAAYIVANKPNANYRLLSDIDLLVLKSAISDAELWLFLNGFTISVSDEYDDFYYRQWMHELPPFVNSVSGITLDLHHNILPLTSKRYINSELFFEKSKKVDTNLFLPCDEDLIIHSSVHLIQDSVFNRTLRDLSDQFWLLKDYSETNSSTNPLIERSKELKLSSDFAKTLTLMSSTFNRCLLEEEELFIQMELGKSLFWPLEKYCYVTMLFQPVTSEWKFKHYFASSILYLKSHLIKMPFGMLVKHLVVKSFKRIKMFFGHEKD